MSQFLYFVAALCGVGLIAAWLYAPTAGVLFFLPVAFIAIVCMAFGKIIYLMETIAEKQVAPSRKATKSSYKKPFWKDPSKPG